jgi:hypothetical protein
MVGPELQPVVEQVDTVPVYGAPCAHSVQNTLPPAAVTPGGCQSPSAIVVGAPTK